MSSLRQTILRAFNRFARSYYDADPTGKEFKKRAAKDYVRGRAADLRRYVPGPDLWKLEELEELSIAKLETATLRLDADPDQDRADDDDPDRDVGNDFRGNDQLSFLDKIVECYIDGDGKSVTHAPGRLTYEQEKRRLTYLKEHVESLSVGLEKERKLFELHEAKWKATPDLTFNEILGREQKKTG